MIGTKAIDVACTSCKQEPGVMCTSGTFCSARLSCGGEDHSGCKPRRSRAIKVTMIHAIKLELSIILHRILCRYGIHEDNIKMDAYPRLVCDHCGRMK